MKISVIVPVYKVEQYLRRCVDSILAQTFKDFELILVDDGSPDRCGEICEEFAEKDERVRVLHRENGGLSAARNTGIEWALKNSASKWITFVDSDDWVEPTYMEKLLAAVKGTGASVSVCSVAYTNGALIQKICGPVDGEIVVKHPEDVYVKFNSLCVWACGKLFLKADFFDVRFPAGHIHEDRYTIHKIVYKYDRIAIVGKPLLNYFQNPTSILHSPWTAARLDRVHSLKCQVAYFKEHGFSRAEIFSIGLFFFWIPALIEKALIEAPEQQSSIRFMRDELFAMYQREWQRFVHARKCENWTWFPRTSFIYLKLCEAICPRGFLWHVIAPLVARIRYEGLCVTAKRLLSRAKIGVLHV